MPRDAYGRPLVAGAVVCEPVNELGVVCLFGAMAAELGYSVMRVRAEFPDCEALRRVEDGRWERVRVRVEFEFRSGNFARHGHDARGCDVIVCWEHDWEGCPIEVVELKSKVGATLVRPGGSAPRRETNRRGCPLQTADSPSPTEPSAHPPRIAASATIPLPPSRSPVEMPG